MKEAVLQAIAEVRHQEVTAEAARAMVAAPATAGALRPEVQAEAAQAEVTEDNRIQITRI